MKQKIVLLLLLINTVCWMSCEREIKFKGEITDPLLVMNGFLTPDSMVSVHLSQSRFVLEGAEGGILPSISDATVTLFVNGYYTEQLTHAAKGLYIGSYFPKEQDHIMIKAEVNGFKVIEGETVIPKAPDVIITDSVSSVRYSDKYHSFYGDAEKEYQDTYWSAQLRMKLKDRANEENHYFIKGEKYYSLDDGRILPQYIDLEIKEMLEQLRPGKEGYLGDELFGEGSALTNNLFSDVVIDGKELQFNFAFSEVIETKTYINGEKEEEPMREADMETNVMVAEMSKDMYQYIISGNEADATDGNFLVEPVVVHSNIKNGLGILGSYSSVIVSFRYKMRYSTEIDDPRYPLTPFYAD